MTAGPGQGVVPAAGGDALPAGGVAHDRDTWRWRWRVGHLPGLAVRLAGLAGNELVAEWVRGEAQWWAQQCSLPLLVEDTVRGEEVDWPRALSADAWPLPHEVRDQVADTAQHLPERRRRQVRAAIDDAGVGDAQHTAAARILTNTTAGALSQELVDLPVPLGGAAGGRYTHVAPLQQAVQQHRDAAARRGEDPPAVEVGVRSLPVEAQYWPAERIGGGADVLLLDTTALTWPLQRLASVLARMVDGYALVVAAHRGDQQLARHPDAAVAADAVALLRQWRRTGGADPRHLQWLDSDGGGTTTTPPPPAPGDGLPGARAAALVAAARLARDEPGDDTKQLLRSAHRQLGSPSPPPT